MRRLRIGVLDLVTKAPTRALYARIMHPNLASIMPQVVGAWCERAGHDVHFVCYTGFENLLDELPKDLDLLFVGAFTQSAQLAYAISNLFRQRGAVTVLGGPHARCYPEDSAKYFDYVLGFTDQSVIEEVLNGLRALPEGWAAPDGLDAAEGAAVAARALEVRRGDAREGTHHPHRADAGEPGLPLHLQFLHRLDRAVPAARLRGAAGRSQVPGREGAGPHRRVARSELRRAVRRLHARDRGGRAAGPDAPHRGEQPVAALGAASRSASGATASRPCCPASSRGSAWATSRRRGTPACRRSKRPRTTST